MQNPDRYRTTIYLSSVMRFLNRCISANARSSWGLVNSLEGSKSDRAIPSKVLTLLRATYTCPFAKFFLFGVSTSCICVKMIYGILLVWLVGSHKNRLSLTTFRTGRTAHLQVFLLLLQVTRVEVRLTFLFSGGSFCTLFPFRVTACG